MGYMRAMCPYTYVEGESDGDYVFESNRGIEDYGSIKNETIIEILFSQAEYSKSKILKHLAKRLAENLNIRLRDKPLSFEEWNKIHWDIHKRFEKSIEELKINSEKLKPSNLKQSSKSNKSPKVGK